MFIGGKAMLKTRQTVPHRAWILATSLLVVLTTLPSAVVMLVWRHGHAFLPIELLQYTPFTSFVVPALLLGGVVGGTSLACALLVWRRSAWALDATLLAAGALTLWIVVEAALFR